MASAGCSRPLEVPVAPMGFSVTLDGDKAGGAFVEFIEQVAASAGCRLHMPQVPRARLEFMFEQGDADVMLASTHSEKRDQFGVFIPLVQTRSVMVSLKGSTRPAIHSLAELLATPALRVAAVRGFDYGPAYRQAVDQLKDQHRLLVEKDPLEVARLLKANMADVTIMPASALYGAAVVDPRVSDIATNLRIEPLDELPWTYGGLYLSNRIPEADRKILEKAIRAANRNHALLNAYRRYYPAEMVNAGTRAL
ncbi:transporter substrate-binding domain-containing protein [Massilia agilis]|uniref:Transporter substrate-binding domain-containing protein n=1 Tax=Massilia agilis TaxID=1811226 RepID=A0ABT2D7H2_9BURK|nr:transporter substrate-binding domain-containing protein [Massilia agilis]MCS0806764.1 transporter substrate-binding domain-containing protein [Massilia agilis]